MIIISICLSIISIVGTGYLIWFKDYMKEKGKNLASKEDIQEITKLAGEIKTELALVKETKMSFQLERRVALKKYFIKLNRYVYYVLAISDFYAKFQDAAMKFDGLTADFYNADGALSLFFEGYIDITPFATELTYKLGVIENYYLRELSDWNTFDHKTKLEHINAFQKNMKKELPEIISALDKIRVRIQEELKKPYSEKV